MQPKLVFLTQSNQYCMPFGGNQDGKKKTSNNKNRTRSIFNPIYKSY